jgi:hypothetical protein
MERKEEIEFVHTMTHLDLDDVINGVLRSKRLQRINAPDVLVAREIRKRDAAKNHLVETLDLLCP